MIASMRALPVFLLLLLILKPSLGCSVLSHEAVIDALWDVKLKSVLLAQFPNATNDELKQAHGYAYGGAIIQDLGYYPHGNKTFSDLTHYVRTGDFVLALISESQDLNELAFALGALSHYISDIEVHRSATNRGEPLLYPKLERKYGAVVTYEDDPAAHLKTEFAFDVLEVAKGNFAAEVYHDFIGFHVAAPLLDRAFHDTYGLELRDLFSNFDRTVGSYRRAVSNTIPKATRIAWAQKRDEIQQSQPGRTQKNFIYVMSRSSYERDWGKQYDRPTPGERFLASLLKLLPPIGPLRALRFQMPTPPVEKLFMESFTRCAAQYGAALDNVKHKKLELEDRNYDTGSITLPGTYRLADDVYAEWLDLLAKKNFGAVTPDITTELLGYYKDTSAPIDTKKHPKKWKRVLSELGDIKTARAAASAAQ
jgi:zinc dependent phospholipase C